MAAAAASTSIDVSINHAFRTLGTVKALKHELDKDYFDDIEQIFEKAMKDVTERTSKLLFNLHVTRQNEKVLKKIIDMVPSSLKCTDSDDFIPVHVAAYYDNTPRYVLPLVDAAIEHNVFEEEERGGLLVDNPEEANALQNLALAGEVDTLKKLRASNLLMKKDIKSEDLIFHAACNGCENTMNYLLELDPDALKTNIRKGEHRGLPITHAVIEHQCEIVEFSILAKVAIKYHQYDIGLIFQKDEDGKTAIERGTIGPDGEAYVFHVLNEHLIPFIDPEVPILHHCANNAPHLMDTFTKYYPSAIFLRDEHGRTLRQAELASGKKTFAKNAYFFANITDADLRVADPKEDLYPFMMAASSMDTTSLTSNQTENEDINDDTNSDVLIPQIPRCDLSAVYYLIRRDPSFAYGGRRARKNRKRKIAKVL